MGVEKPPAEPTPSTSMLVRAPFVSEPRLTNCCPAKVCGGSNEGAGMLAGAFTAFWGADSGLLSLHRPMTALYSSPTTKGVLPGRMAVQSVLVDDETAEPPFTVTVSFAPGTWRTEMTSAHS